MSRFAVPLVLVALISVPSSRGQEAEGRKIPLWGQGAPGFESRRDEAEVVEGWKVTNVHNPSITAFLPTKEKANGAAVIICPGGGHRQLGYLPEGVETARYFNAIGVAAFVLKYRLGREPESPYKIEVHAREDGLRALRLVRSRAEEFGVDPKRVGILGFSAGGEVVSLVAFRPTAGDPVASDPVDRLDARPDFLVYVYPGPVGVPETIPKDAPPAFLVVANDDTGAARVVADLFRKYRDAGASVEAHVFAKGGHAFNMGQRSKLAALKNWPQRLTDWLGDGEFLGPLRP